MATWTMPMYRAASPGNLLPKFSVPKLPPGPGGTIAHLASVLQKAIGVVAAGEAAAGGHWVVGGVEVAPAPARAPSRTTTPETTARRANLDFIAAPFVTGSPARHGAAGGSPAERPGRPRGSTASDRRLRSGR